MSTLAELSESSTGPAPVLFVMEGEPRTIDAFFAGRDPDARVVADQDGSLRQLLGVRRGGLRAMFGLGAWRTGIRSFLRGNLIGRKRGADGWTLPAFLVVESGRVTWRYDGAHAGDHPDLAAALARVTAEFGGPASPRG